MTFSEWLSRKTEQLAGFLTDIPSRFHHPSDDSILGVIPILFGLLMIIFHRPFGKLYAGDEREWLESGRLFDNYRSTIQLNQKLFFVIGIAAVLGGICMLFRVDL